VSTLCCKLLINHEQMVLPDVCKFTALKDLSAVCCASPPGYNRNFSDLPRISELASKYSWKSI